MLINELTMVRINKMIATFYRNAFLRQFAIQHTLWVEMIQLLSTYYIKTSSGE
jgi:hypothetical protein